MQTDTFSQSSKNLLVSKTVDLSVVRVGVRNQLVEQQVSGVQKE